MRSLTPWVIKIALSASVIRYIICSYKLIVLEKVQVAYILIIHVCTRHIVCDRTYTYHAQRMDTYMCSSRLTWRHISFSRSLLIHLFLGFKFLGAKINKLFVISKLFPNFFINFFTTYLIYAREDCRVLWRG